MGNDRNWERHFSEQKNKEEAERLRRIEEEDTWDPKSVEGAPTREEWLSLERANAEVQEELEDLKRRGCVCETNITGGYMTANIGPQLPHLSVTPKAGCSVPEHQDELARREKLTEENRVRMEQEQREREEREAQNSAPSPGSSSSSCTVMAVSILAVIFLGLWYSA